MTFDVTSKMIVAMSATGGNQVQQNIGGVGAAITNTTQKSAAAGTQAKLTGQQFAALSAQVQDFAIQVQAGQSPLTALLQQGSQLSSQFGGFGNALAVVRAALPPTVLAIGGLAAVGAAAALAYKQGREEVDAWTRSVVLSGNAAGVTTGMLRGLAQDQAALAGTQGRAAQIQLQLIESGAMAGAQFARATEAAIALERAGGPAIDSTTKKLIDLGKSPLATLVRLNEAEHFLTMEVYSQVKALEDQGRKTDAAAVAQNAYANTAIDRAKALETQLGTLQKAWRGVGEGASKAWDFMLDIGRQKTPEQELAEIERALAAPVRRGGNTLQAEERRKAMAERAEQLRFEIYAAREGAAAQEAEAERVTKAIDNMAEELAAKAAHVQGAFAIASARIRADISAVESQARRGMLSPIEAIERIADKNVELLKAEKKEIGALIGIAQERGAKDSELAGLRAQYGVKDIEITAAIAEKNNQVAEAMEARQRAAREAYRTELEEGERLLLDYKTQSGKAYAALVDQVSDYARGIDEANEGLQLEASLIGQSDRVRAVAVERLRIELQRRQQIRQIQEAPDVRWEEREEQRARVNEAAARASAMAESKVVVEEFQKANDQIRDGLADALMEGGDSAADYLEHLFKNMVLRPVVQAMMQPVAGAMASFLTGGQGAGGGGGGGMGWLSSASSLYSNGSSWLSGLWGGGAAASGAAGSGISAGYGGMTAGYSGTGISAGYGSTAAGYTGSGITAGSAAGAEAGGAAAGGASSAASAIPIIGWIIAGFMASLAAYKAGHTQEELDGAAKWGTPGGTVSASHYAVFKALGMSDKWANVLSGSSAVARLFGHKASASGFGIGTVQDGDFVQGSSSPMGFGDNTRGGGVDPWLQGLSGDMAASVALAASRFGGGLTNGMRFGALTDRDREGEVSSLMGFFGADNKLIAGTQTGSGAFGAGGPGMAASKIASDDLPAWIATQLPVMIIQGLQQSDLADRFDEYFDSIAAASLSADVAQHMLATATAVQGLTDLFAPIGGVFDQFKTLSVDAFENLATLGGGFDAVGTAASSYYQQFYSEAERTQDSWDTITHVLADVGINTVPATKDSFRQLVDTLDLSTESGRETYTALMGVSGAFAQLVDASDAAAAAQEVAIADKRFDLEVELMRAQGDELGAVNREREHELELLDKLDPSLANLQRQIYAVKDAAAQSLVRSPFGNSDDTADKSMWTPAWAREQLQNRARADWEIKNFNNGLVNGSLKFGLQNYVGSMDSSALFNEFVLRSRANDIGSKPYDGRGNHKAADNDGAETEYAAKLREQAEREAKLMEEQNDSLRKLIDSNDKLSASLGDYLQSLTVGEYSVLTPQQQYDQQRQLVEGLLHRALDQDDATAAAAFEGAATTFLNLSRAQNASGMNFVLDQSYVVDAIKDLRQDVAELTAHAAAQVRVAQDAAQQTVSELKVGNALASDASMDARFAAQSKVK